MPSSLVSLGLDLRGGAHLLAEVHVQGVHAVRMELLWPQVRDALHDLRDQVGSVRRQNAAPGELRVTLTNPGDPVRIPEVSPNHIDWELELGVIIGRTAKNVKEADALNYVAGYTVVNDISDRKFRPNPGRTQREKDGFFDWLHGKWHDTFCPMGPCVLPADELPDPQTLHMTLKVNGGVEQDGSTAEMVFPVAAIIEFISSFVTLVPGDIISTGTTAGVGHAKGKFLKAGDVMEAWIEQIGTLRSPVV